MQVTLHDALTLDARRRSGDGYMAVRAKAARAGVYDYLGREVDPEGKKFAADQVVKVYRPAEEVFDQASLASFVAKPITDEHPTQAVNARNWKDHARGTVFGATDEDGTRTYVSFDLAFMDAALIDAVDSGKRELSNGYACDIAFEDGTAPDGTAYQAIQRNIRGNHVAVVRRGRAGSECRVADSEAVRFATCDANPAAVAAFTQEKPTMKIKIGDAEVDATNGEAVRIAVDALNTKLAASQTEVGKLTADLETANTALQTKDGEIAALNTKLADAVVTPERLQQLADARADVIAKAKTLAPAIVTDGKSDADIRKEAVTAKLGDKATDMTDAAIEGAFTALTADAKAQDGNSVQSLGQPANIADGAAAADEARKQMIADMLNPAAAKAA